MTACFALQHGLAYRHRILSRLTMRFTPLPSTVARDSGRGQKESAARPRWDRHSLPTVPSRTSQYLVGRSATTATPATQPPGRIHWRFLTCLLDLAGHHEGAATINDRDLYVCELAPTLTIAHLRDVLGEKIYHSLTQGCGDDTAEMMTYAHDQIDQARAGTDRCLGIELRETSPVRIAALPSAGRGCQTACLVPDAPRDYRSLPWETQNEAR